AFLQVFSRPRKLRIVRFLAGSKAHSLRCSSFQKHSRAVAAGLVDNFGLPLCGCVFVNGGFRSGAAWAV
ncbi:MAG: hypothetical protein IKQ10_06705, partial [Oscillospiraceae bacterium]|nr:hypothetical protein [Oscillospiraceae bacterium]